MTHPLPADTPALDAIRTNALGLLEDAKLLFENGRYPRAAALAVLCVEEVGKFFLVKHGHDNWKDGCTRHRGKQNVAASFFLAEVLLAAVLDNAHLLSPQALDDDWEETEAAKTLIDNMAQAARDKMGSHQVLEKAKNRGLYVDLSSSGSVEHKPSDIGQEKAADCLALAGRAVCWCSPDPGLLEQELKDLGKKLQLRYLRERGQMWPELARALRRYGAGPVPKS